MAKNVIKKVALGAAVAGMAGYVAGILSAPRSGKKTMAKLKNKGEADVANLEERLKSLLTQLNELISGASEEGKGLDASSLKQFKRAITKAQTARTKLEKVVAAVKAGGSSENKDLDMAVKEAEKAIKHAKNYLLKQ